MANQCDNDARLVVQIPGPRCCTRQTFYGSTGVAREYDFWSTPVYKFKQANHLWRIGSTGVQFHIIYRAKNK